MLRAAAALAGTRMHAAVGTAIFIGAGPRGVEAPGSILSSWVQGWSSRRVQGEGVAAVWALSGCAADIGVPCGVGSSAARSLSPRPLSLAVVHACAAVASHRVRLHRVPAGTGLEPLRVAPCWGASSPRFRVWLRVWGVLGSGLVEGLSVLG